jgi:2-polyprenyl-6-methoxyphenol hydroxylase-like FAD-dependent oxidoreductase
MHEIEADVVVVGARCAGASTAMLLAREGHRVVLLDRATFPSDALSTHAIARGGVVLLQRWGLLDAVLASGAPPIRRVRFHLGGEVVDRPLTPRSGVDLLVAPRRRVLDQLLLDAAQDAGVDVRTGVTVTGVTRRDGRVTGVTTPDLTVRGHVVGADGVRSRLAAAVGASMLDDRGPGGAAHYAYFRRPDWDGFEFHIAERTMAGVFPTHGGEANVWVCTPAVPLRGDRPAAFARLLAAANPALAERVALAERTSPVRSAVGLPNHLRQAWGPGWCLAGDAALHRDPVTGHGMTDAFRDAELLARALDGVLRGVDDEAEAGRRYEAQRLELVTEQFEATVAMSAYPALDEFVAQQRRSTAAMEDEARFLADLPQPTHQGALP